MTDSPGPSTLITSKDAAVVEVVEGSVERPAVPTMTRRSVGAVVPIEEGESGMPPVRRQSNEDARNYDDDEEMDDLLEPRFKYKRVMGEDLQKIFASEPASCFAVHGKFIAMGTQSGFVYIMDHSGNVHRENSRRNHGCAVTHIDIDKGGDYIMSCANDAKVVIYGFGTDEFNQVLKLPRPARAIAIADDFGKANSGQGLAVGDNCVKIFERRFLLKPKETVCEEGGTLTSPLFQMIYQGHDRDGMVAKISWRGPYVAFTNDSGTKVYDRGLGKLITSVKREHSLQLPTSKFPPQHCWLNDETLAIGWANTVAVCQITTSAEGILSGGAQPSKFGELLHRFTLGTFIAGISFTADGLDTVGGAQSWREIVLFCLRVDDGSAKTANEAINGADLPSPSTSSSIDQSGTAIAPPPSCVGRTQILLLDPDGFDKHLTVGEDSIEMRDGDSLKLNQCHMVGLPADTLYFLLVGRDMITANEVSPDDHIVWLLENELYREALLYAEENAGKLKRTSVLEVGRKLLDHLIALGRHQKAAGYLKRVCGRQKDVWEAYVSEFERAKCVLLLADVLPQKEPQLEPECYEYVLTAALEQNAFWFRKLVRTWSPDIYRVGAIADLTSQHIYKMKEQKRPPGSDIALIQALAHMYVYERNYEHALKLYLMIKDRNAFAMIDQHQLFGMVKERITELMSIDEDLAIRLLLENADQLSPKAVLNQINKQPKLQMAYLNRLIARHEAGDFGDLAIRLYANYDRKKLLPFLRSAENFNINKALALCQEKQFMQETVFLLGRSGNRLEALRVIVEQMGRFDLAIEFCREHDEQHLWTTLIQAAMRKPEYITELLRHVGTCFDPLTVVEQIPCGMVIPGLRDLFVKVVGDYALQIQLQNGCRLVTIEDVVELMRGMLARAESGTRIDTSCVCAICRDNFLITADREPTYAPMDALLLGCGHVVHRTCELERFGDAIDPDSHSTPCPICSEPVPDF